MSNGPSHARLARIFAGLNGLARALRKLSDATRDMHRSMELLDAALEGPPVAHDVACDRFLNAAIRPHLKRASQYSYRPPTRGSDHDVAALIRRLSAR